MRGLRSFLVLAFAMGGITALAACSHLLRVTEADPRPEVSLCDTSAAPSCPSLALVTNDPDRTTDNVTSAVESMYERLAVDLFPRGAAEAGPAMAVAPVDAPPPDGGVAP